MFQDLEKAKSQLQSWISELVAQQFWLTLSTMD
jgi:hypothetical protein